MSISHGRCRKLRRAARRSLRQCARRLRKCLAWPGTPLGHRQDDPPLQRPARQPAPRRVHALEQRRPRLRGRGPDRRERQRVKNNASCTATVTPEVADGVAQDGAGNSGRVVADSRTAPNRETVRWGRRERPHRGVGGRARQALDRASAAELVAPSPPAGRREPARDSGPVRSPVKLGSPARRARQPRGRGSTEACAARRAAMADAPSAHGWQNGTAIRRSPPILPWREANTTPRERRTGCPRHRWPFLAVPSAATSRRLRSDATILRR